MVVGFTTTYAISAHCCVMTLTEHGNILYILQTIKLNNFTK